VKRFFASLFFVEPGSQAEAASGWPPFSGSTVFMLGQIASGRAASFFYLSLYQPHVLTSTHRLMSFEILHSSSDQYQQLLQIICSI